MAFAPVVSMMPASGFSIGRREGCGWTRAWRACRCNFKNEGLPFICEDRTGMHVGRTGQPDSSCIPQSFSIGCVALLCAASAMRNPRNSGPVTAALATSVPRGPAVAGAEKTGARRRPGAGTAGGRAVVDTLTPLCVKGLVLPAPQALAAGGWVWRSLVMARRLFSSYGLRHEGYVVPSATKSVCIFFEWFASQRSRLGPFLDRYGGLVRRSLLEVEVVCLLLSPGTIPDP